MPVEIIGDVNSNEVLISPEFLDAATGVIHLRGEGNTIRIEKPSYAGSIYCTLHDGGSITIGRGFQFYELSIHALSRSGVIIIGERCAFNGKTAMAVHEPSQILIGKNALFAGGCNIHTSDVHKIYDVDTGNRINPPRDIAIGDRVWVGGDASIMKGAKIGSDSVVGARSVVTSEFASNSLIAGVPARLIRSGIRWEP
ncbi:acyltransferase [Methylorubrum aminovorans]